jgi:molybdopterin/thiamine biosynthesis adenylyltransferase/rhodanese-related sulfurtransferase
VIPHSDPSAAAESGTSGLRRFARHLSLPEFGAAGQERLRRSTILCIGAGGLGSPVLMYLAAAGVGHIRIVDDDSVDLTNLQRQLLFTDADIGKPKAEAAAARLRTIYPDIVAEAHRTRFLAVNAMELAVGCDLIIDGSDNFSTRYLSNDTAVLLGVPNVYGSIFRYEGQATVFAPRMGGPCYRCLFPVPPAPGTVPSCAEGGVLGVLPGLIGMIQATEAIKLLTGIGEPLTGRVVHVDTRTMQFRELKLRRDPACPVCGDQPTITALSDIGFSCDLPAPGKQVEGITAPDFANVLASPPPGVCILDVREAWEHLLTPWTHATLAIPFADLPSRLSEIPGDCKEIIVVCSIGERSADAVHLLKQEGHSAVRHLKGGLRDMEPS